MGIRLSQLSSGGGQHLVAIERFMLQERLCELFQLVASFNEQLACPFVRRFGEPSHFRLDECSCLGRLARLGVGYNTKFFAHAVLGDHGLRNLRSLLKVGRGARGDVVGSKDEFLSHATAHANVHFGQHLLAGHGSHVLFRQLRHHSQGLASRHNGCLVDRQRPGGVCGDEGVAAFVVRSQLSRLVANDGRLAFGAHENLVLGVLQLAHGNGG
mmetsp:Transcript_451/g.1036  ORF Transcript_451/g.1036 Transcript_451/m.1036 type:complete len:213 (+) Transcript_451:653-1291(+)